MTEQGKEAEQYAIGSILTDDSKIVQLIELPEEYFYRAEHKAIHRAVSDLFSQSMPVDLFSISEQLERTQAALGVDWMGYLTELAENHPSSAHFESYANTLADYAKRRELSAAVRNVGMQLDHGADVSEIMEYLQGEVINMAAKSSGESFTDFKDVLAQGLKEVERRQDMDGVPDGQVTHYPILDDALDGFQDELVYVVAGRTSMGKAQPLTSKVLMADGSFKLMGDIRLGDTLASVDGRESLVMGVYPQGKRPVYRVEFSDGRVVEADADHLWKVSSCRWGQSRVLKTTDLEEKLSRVRYKSRLKVETHDGSFGQDIELGVSPWLIGLLLGDGCLTESGVCFSNPEQYIKCRAEKESGLPVRSSDDGVGNWFFSGKGKRHEIRKSLESLGMMGLRSYEKSVPEPVFSASRSFRGLVLAGLLESDGWIEKFGSVQFSSSSESLSDGVVRLVRSLGGCAYIKEKARFFTYKGERKVARNAFCVSIALDGLDEFIQSPRLLSNFKVRSRDSAPTIKSIKFDRCDETQCISVTHSDHLYITDDYIVTHNTAFTLQLVYRLADKRPWLIFSLEMSKKSIGMRAIANAANIFGGKLKGRPKLNQADFDDMVPAVGAWMDKPIYVDQTPGLAVAQIRARAKVQELRLGPLGGIVIDHVGLLKKHKGMSATESATENSHALQALAKEMHCPLIEVVQINRGAEGSNDKRPGLSDLKQTGAWEEDADVAILLYRDEYYNENTQYKGVTEANIAKNRDGETKTIGYNHVLATGRYTEFGEFQQGKATKSKGADL